MKELNFSLLISAYLLFALISACATDNRLYHSESDVDGIQTIISSIDTIILESTNKQTLDSAYREFFDNYNVLYTSTGIVPEIFNLLVRLQDNSYFFDIWRLGWVLDVESGHREIWLSFNLSAGDYWVTFSEGVSDFAQPIRDSYNIMVERDIWHGFQSICKSDLGIEDCGEMERAYIALIIITNTVNSL